MLLERIPPVVFFIGPTGSGKTILVEKVIARLRREEIQVGVIKHYFQDSELDKLGEDSLRYKQAGANPILLAGDDTLTFMERPFGHITLADLIERFKDKADIIIVEGFQAELVKDVEYFRFVFGPPFPPVEDNTGNIVTAGEMDAAPCRIKFKRDQVESVAAWIMRWLASR